MTVTSSNDSIYTDSNTDGATRDGHSFKHNHTLRDYILAYASIGVGVLVFVVFLYFYLSPLLRQHRAAKAEKRRQSLLRPLGLDNESLRSIGLSKTFYEKTWRAETPPEKPFRVIVRDSLAAKVIFRQSRPVELNPFRSSKRQTFRPVSGKSGFLVGGRTFDDRSSFYSFASDHKSVSNFSNSKKEVGSVTDEVDDTFTISNSDETISSVDSSKKTAHKAIEYRESSTVPPVPPMPALAYASTTMPLRLRSTSNARPIESHAQSQPPFPSRSALASRPRSPVPAQGDFPSSHATTAASHGRAAFDSQSPLITGQPSRSMTQYTQTWASQIPAQSSANDRLQTGEPAYGSQDWYRSNEHDFSAFY